MPPDLDTLADEDFCYLTTVGRVTGRPHEIEIWFAIEGQTLYMLSGGQDRSKPTETSAATRRSRYG